MTGTNHVITGAVIAGVVQQPLLVVPLAFMSHFLLDSLPHFGFPNWDEARIKQRHLIHRIIATDTALLVMVLISFLVLGAPVIFYVGGLAALSPDLVWVYQFIVHHRLEASDSSSGTFNDFHKRIQSRERPSGIYIELAYLTVIATILVILWP